VNDGAIFADCCYLVFREGNLNPVSDYGSSALEMNIDFGCLGTEVATFLNFIFYIFLNSKMVDFSDWKIN